jgi:DNA-directed RNA polymerase subunit RPC12/RpoP
MAKCPGCGQEVRTPFFLNTEAWRWLTCPYCKARLEMKPPRSVALIPFMLVGVGLGRLGHVPRLIPVAVAAAIVIVMLVESMYPRLRLRKALPKPEIRLDISGPAE